MATMPVRRAATSTRVNDGRQEGGQDQRGLAQPREPEQLEVDLRLREAVEEDGADRDGCESHEGCVPGMAKEAIGEGWRLTRLAKAGPASL